MDALQTPLLAIPLANGGTVDVIAEAPSDVVLAAPGKEVANQVAESLKQLFTRISPAIEDVRDGLATLRPAKVTIEFGVQLGGESGIVIAKATTEVHFLVRCEWETENLKPEADT